MQFFNIITALFVAVAAAAPAAEPAANADGELFVPGPAPAEFATPDLLVKRQSFCTQCSNGGRVCCSLTACYTYSC